MSVLFKNKKPQQAYETYEAEFPESDLDTLVTDSEDLKNQLLVRLENQISGSSESDVNEGLSLLLNDLRSGKAKFTKKLWRRATNPVVFTKEEIECMALGGYLSDKLFKTTLQNKEIREKYESSDINQLILNFKNLSGDSYKDWITSKSEMSKISSDFDHALFQKMKS